MRYTGIQPQYFPRLHYFARILNTDLFMIRDDAQFVRKHKYPGGYTDKSYQADTLIKQAQGKFWLQVPIVHNGFQPIYKTHISYDNEWVSSHLKTLTFLYKKAACFDEIYPEIEQILAQRYRYLSELTIATIGWGFLRLMTNKPVAAEDISMSHINAVLEKQTEFRLKKVQLATQTKSFPNFVNLSPNEKILLLCRENGITEDYCGGTSVAAYVDHELFKKNGIQLTVQDWKCGEYPQQFMSQQSFLPNLSIIDLLMNVSTKVARSVLKG